MPNVLPAPILERTACNETREERRRRERLKVRLPVHVRPLDRSERQIQEVATTLDVTRHGLCFTTSRDHYHVGMSLLLTFPYCSAKLLRKDYLGDVIRVDQVNGGQAVAVLFRPESPIAV